MKELSGREFAAEVVGLFGLRKGTALLGWLTAVGVTAPEGAGRSWLLEHAPGGPRNRRLHVQDCEVLARHLQSRGLTLSGVSDSERGMVEALRRSV